MSYVKDCEFVRDQGQGKRSNSSQGLATVASSSAVKIPLPPRLWITDGENDSSDCSDVSKDDGYVAVERARVRSRFRHYKQRCVNVPIGIFWDIENCQVPRGCSALDVVSAIRNKFLTGRREADFVVVCDVRKESANRLQELNDAQVNLIHVCGTQKNAADEKLRQCMRRFGELHVAPAAMLLISGDINFAADLSDFRHRKNLEVILVHKQNTSPALIACASSHYSFNDLTDDLPRHPKSLSQTEEEEPTCEMEVTNLPLDQPAERVSKRLRRLADNCGGKVLRVTASTAMLKFPTPDHASRALKRMDGEDVFGRKIGTRYARSGPPPTYSSDEGYGTATAANLPLPPPPQSKQELLPPRPESLPPRPESLPPRLESLPLDTQVSATVVSGPLSACDDGGWWRRALQHLPAPPAPPRPRQIRGTHGSSSLTRSDGSSSASEERGREASTSRAVSPWNCSGSASEHSDADEPPPPAELTVSGLPPFDPVILKDMVTSLFSQHVRVLRVSVWAAAEGPVASVVVWSEWDARLAIARVHKRRLDHHWNGRRLELALGRPSPVPNLDILRARLRAILLEQSNHCLPLLRLRDAYASRHCCALTASDLAKIKDTVVIHDGLSRLVQLVDLSPVACVELEAAPWRCAAHARAPSGCEDAAAVLQPVVIEIAVLASHVHMLLDTHGGIVPLLSFVECYESMFTPLRRDATLGVPLELLLHAVAGAEVRDAPARHLAWKPAVVSPSHSGHSDSSGASGERDRERPRTAPTLEPMLALFERELVDLLRSEPRCCIPFSKLIPSFHHHFGRQCRVADYGFTKLPDLLAALSNTVVVLGSGSSRVITLSAAAQSRRWSSDLVKLLKAQPGRAVHPRDIPQLYQATFGTPFTPVNYGVCTLAELMERLAPDAVTVGQDGTLSLPKPMPTAEEKARTVQFAKEAVALLCLTANFRMEFSRFVPAYHAHFGRQLRVAHYGCVKLIELFELISDAVTVCCDANGEKSVKLAVNTARSVMGERLRRLGVIPVECVSAAYAAVWGAPPSPEAVGARSVRLAVFACGGAVERGLVRPPGDAPDFANAALAACALLAADMSVARGSTIEYLTGALRRCQVEVQLEELEAAGVVEVCGRRVRGSAGWRAAWRTARLLVDTPPISPQHILAAYAQMYDDCYAQRGVEGILEILCGHPMVFCESGGSWGLRAGVTPPAAPAPPHARPDDYSLYDTPPGQKGSRVFESPNVNIWCSPPASALPAPTALLTNDNKRRTRLAAQFDAV